MSARKPRPGDIYARYWGGKVKREMNIVLIDAKDNPIFLKGCSSGILSRSDIKTSSMKMGTNKYILIGTLQGLEDTIREEVFKDE